MQRRFSHYILTLAVITVLNFLIPRVMPGDPVNFLLGTEQDLPVQIDEETRQMLLEYHGLDKPITHQFLRYISNLAHLDLGFAIYYKCKVSTLILNRLPWTILLMGTSFCLATLIGIILGAASGYRQGTKTDQALLGSAVVMGSIPVFLLGMLAVIFLSVKLKLFPLGGATSPFAQYSSSASAALDILWHLALPALVLTMEQVMGTFLLMRNSMVTILGEPYMLYAHAKGLSRYRVAFQHGVPNAVLPVFTRLGMKVGFLITGTIFIETIFNYPGVGRLTYEAVLMHDYPVIQGIFFISMLSIVGANALVDGFYRYIDPRIRN
jgi:peptide/nickel transport system permease protein